MKCDFIQRTYKKNSVKVRYATILYVHSLQRFDLTYLEKQPQQRLSYYNFQPKCTFHKILPCHMKVEGREMTEETSQFKAFKKVSKELEKVPGGKISIFFLNGRKYFRHFREYGFITNTHYLYPQSLTYLIFFFRSACTRISIFFGLLPIAFLKNEPLWVQIND